MTVWIYTDADNTLWDTDALFAQAQLSLLDAAENASGVKGPTTGRLQYVRDFDQAIAARHHQRLRYPPVLLLRALRTGLLGVSVEFSAQKTLIEGAIPLAIERDALSAYAAMISGLPPLLAGVEEGLRLARETGAPVYVVSEGPLDSVRARLQAHNLDQLTAGALSAQKTADLYARLLQRAAPHRAVMVGDQPDRDCRLAKDAGMFAVLVLSRFRPNWVTSADATCADAVVDDFKQAIKAAVNLAD